MLQDIQEKIAETTDIKSALRLVLKAEARYCVLKFFGETNSEEGQIWLRNGNEIVAASTPSGDKGHHALLKVLMLQYAKCQLLDATSGQEGENISIKVLDILEDEELVVQSLKSVLGAVQSNESESDDSWTFETQEKIGIDFHTTTKLMSELSEDDLAAARKEEIERLQNVATDAPENFYVSGLVKHENDIGAQRQQEYEYLKDFDAEEKEAFYETPVEILKDPPDGLTDLQQSVLKIMEQQYSDKEAFLHTDSSLADISSLPPTWTETDIPLAQPSAQPMSMMPNSLQGSSIGSASFGPPAVSSISAIPNSQFTENPANLTDQQLLQESQRMRAVDPNMALLEQSGRTFDPKVNQESTLTHRVKRGLRISRPILIGVAIAAIALPVVAFNIVKHNEEETLLDLDERETTSAHVNSYVDKESRAAQPQEPFRMPAGTTNGSAPQGHGWAADAEQGFAGHVDKDAAENFKWKQPSQPAAAMSAADMADAEKQITAGEQLMQSGQIAAALQQLEAAVARYPRFSRLRVAAIEANRKLGRYERVRQLCIDGMNQAPVESDFYLFLNMLKDAPKPGQSQETTIAPEHLAPKAQPARVSAPRPAQPAVPQKQTGNPGV